MLEPSPPLDSLNGVELFSLAHDLEEAAHGALDAHHIDEARRLAARGALVARIVHERAEPGTVLAGRSGLLATRLSIVARNYEESSILIETLLCGHMHGGWPLEAHVAAELMFMRDCIEVELA